MPILICPFLVFAVSVTLGMTRMEAMDPSEIWQGPIRFTHPMTVTNLEELAAAKEKIERQVEPQYSAWLQLQTSVDGSTGRDLR